MNERAEKGTIGPAAEPDAGKDSISSCPVCGTKMPASRSAEPCPVCLLRGALDSDAEGLSGMGDSAEALEKRALSRSSKFDHYELSVGDDGTPIELGHGGMGVTYRAFDSNLRCPVALKVINSRYLNDESARLRFLREARAAARIRHPNVASVFHLGTKGRDYFYAMEFVEGETLDHLIKRTGPIDVALALNIVDQVAAALGAAHKEQIVHRDIKPSNLMLRPGDNGGFSVKVIDFGLAKVASGSHSDPALSAPGGFAGTALFASPEQCAGSEADSRSDIYSLGVTLWEMLTGNVPFNGTTAEVIASHLHAPLPMDQLKHVPRPVVILLQFMLEKNPALRPQNPFELQSALRAMNKALAQSPKSEGPRKGDRWKSLFPINGLHGLLRAGAAALVLLSAISACFYFFGPKFRPASPVGKSVAILPFDNLSDSRENGYFSDGLTHEVIYQLSRVADLRVIARSSILRYADVPAAHRKSLNEIGAELDVGALLESSVERINNRVKVVTILYATGTSQRLWGASYDREMKDVFTIQSDLAEQIAMALHATLTAAERSGIQRRPTENLTAYDLYLRGRASWEIHRQEDNDKAIELFKQALQQDPKFAIAYVGLAEAYIERVKRFHGEDLWLDSAIDLCKQAIALDPKQPRAYTELASAFNLKGWFDKMQAPVRTALELAPNDWDANRMAAAEATEFRREVMMYTSIRKCFLTNPFDSWAPYELALICWTVGENDLAEKWMQRAINLESDPLKARLMGCERLVYRGEYAAALPGLRELPPDLKTHYTTSADLVLYCSMQVGDWQTVVSSSQAKLQKESGNPTALLRLALGLRGIGKEEESRQTAERAVALALQKLPTAKSPRWMRFDLAVGHRLLEHKDQAFQQLKELLNLGGLPDPVLGNRDPGMDLFKRDAEFQEISAEFSKQNEAKRTRILDIEKS